MSRLNSMVPVAAEISAEAGNNAEPIATASTDEVRGSSRITSQRVLSEEDPELQSHQSIQLCGLGRRTGGPGALAFLADIGQPTNGHSQDNSVIAHPPRHSFTVEEFQQRYCVFSGDLGESLESRDVDLRALLLIVSQ